MRLPNLFRRRPTEPQAGISPGDRFGGRWEVKRLVSGGGQALVYEARDLTKVEDRVALKVFGRSDHTYDADERRMFDREVEHTMKVQHEHVVEILDHASEDERRPFIVTRWIKGQTVKALAGRLDMEDIATVAHQTASALDASHACDVYHGDVTYNNIMVEGEAGARFAWLLDFGISRTAMTQTSTGVRAGTPGFQAPEILNGAPLTPESDQYSLACVVFYLVARRSVFTDNHRENHRHVSPPRLSEVAPDDVKVSEALDRAVAKALSKDPLERYPSVSAFIDAAFPPEPAPEPGPDLVTEVEPPRLPAWARALVGTATAVAVAAGLALGLEGAFSTTSPTVLSMAGADLDLGHDWKALPVSVVDQARGIVAEARGDAVDVALGTLSNVAFQGLGRPLKETSVPAGPGRPKLTGVLAADVTQLDVDRLYAFRTGASYAIVTCRSRHGVSRAAAEHACALAVGNLRLRDRTLPVPIPSDEVRQQVSSALGAYSRQQVAWSSTVNTTKDHKKIAAAADLMASKADVAARTITDPDLDDLDSAFTVAANTWRTVAAAARADSTSRYDAAGERLRFAETRIADALDGLTSLGYVGRR